MEVLTASHPFLSLRRSSPTYKEHPHNPSPSTSLVARSNKFFSAAVKSKPIDDVLKLFHILPAHDTVTWNTAIAACLRHWRIDLALRFFLDMLTSCSCQPDAITLRLVFRAASEASDSNFLPQMHAYVLKLRERFSSSEVTVLNTCLLNLYRKFGRLELAHKVFDEIPDKDVVSFTSMLMAFMEEGNNSKALDIFQEMVEIGQFMPNEHAYSCALSACSSASAFSYGQQIHGRILKSSMASHVFVGTSLVDFYVNCGEIGCANRAFSGISEPSVVSWNALMAGKLSGKEAIQLLGLMRSSGVSPDHLTFANVLRACDDDVGIEEVRQLHGNVAKLMRIEMDVFVSIALFEAYLDHGCFRRAQKVFNMMVERDDVAYNLAIIGYIRNGNALEAVTLFIECLSTGKELREVTFSSILIQAGIGLGKQMHAIVVKYGCSTGDSSVWLLDSMVKMYLDHHLLDDAVSVFEQVHQQDLILWTSLISGLSRIGECQFALELYVRMVTEESVEPPNHYMFAALLSSCAQLAALAEGKQIHAQIIKSDQCDTFVTTSLLDMYAKCGYIENSIRLFEQMPKRDLASWNAMIIALALHGFAKRALETFQELVNLKEPEPNSVTYLAVLSACNHCGLLERGYQYFKSIKEPTIDHYACMVDMFARAGKLKEATNFVEKMPFEVNEHIWSSLLAASYARRNIELGEYTAKKLLNLNPTDSRAYIALSNLYAVTGRWTDALHVRKLMKSTADVKHKGLSWVNINSQQHAFGADIRSCMSK